MFKVIIAGGRDFDASTKDMNRIDKILVNYQDWQHGSVPMFNDLEMVTGTAKGADQIPYFYHHWHGVPMKEFPADWKDLDVPICKVKENSYGFYNALAGLNRNQVMADYADALIAFWDGSSTGTKDMIDRATKGGLKVRVIRYVNTG